MTTGMLLLAPMLRAVSAAGAPINGAKLQFYVTGTTTPTPAYTSSTLGTPLADPVVSDSAGLFVPIYLDPTVTYRIQLKDGAGTLIIDIDPVSGGIQEATTAQVNAGVATGVFVSPAKLAAWTGVATALGYTPLSKAGDTATNLTLTNTAPAVLSAGYLGSPVNLQNANYTLALSDCGKTILSNGSATFAITLPPVASVALPVGTVVIFCSFNSGTITITRGAGVSLQIAGTGTSKDVALAEWGFAMAIMVETNEWVISGTGIS